MAALRIAVRSLLKTPGFTVTAVLTLALCLAANVAIFAVVDAVVLRALPYADPGRLVTLYNSYPGAGVPRGGTSFVNYYDRRGALRSFSSMAICSDATTTVNDAGDPTRVQIYDISPGFFKTLGVPLAMGREFTDGEMAYGPNQVAILTHEYWRNHFGSDPKVLGRRFLNDGLETTVVGVLPPGFHYLSNHASFFRPAAHDKDEIVPKNRHNGDAETVARLAPGVTLAQAQGEVDAFNAAQLRDDPYREVVTRAGFHTTVAGLREDHVREVRPMLLILQAGVALLLLIGAVNLANLFLIRATNRTKEIAVRRALGARGRHLVSEVLAETLLVGLAGGLLGILLGAFGVRLLGLLGTDALPLGADVRFDGPVAGAALAAALAASVLLAVPASWFGVRGGLAAGLRAESRSGTAGAAVQRLRQLFIVIQVALAFVLLSGAALLAVSLRNVLARPPGFRAEHLYGGYIALPWHSYQTTAQREQFVRRLLPALLALPGTRHAAVTTNLPFDGPPNNTAVTVFDDPAHAPVRAHFLNCVSGDYWAALHIPLLRGRLFSDDECRQRRRVVVVDQAFASRYWPGMDPVGRQLTDDVVADRANAYTVVGVVATIRESSLTEAADHGTVYFPYPKEDFSTGHFAIAIESAAPAPAVAPMVRQAVKGVDPEIPLASLRPMEDRIGDTLVSRRSPAILAGIFAGVALLLAAVGTFGVLSYTVSQRRREIGIRMALGARPEQIRSQFLSAGLRILALGAIAGAAGSWIAGRCMQSILFDVPALQPLSLAASLLFIGSATLCACLYPALAASRIDPMAALREE
ncbi:MAG TPA: ADOP family duplicated permease [Opitutaceae bacterium]|nr:ADOP family duplicated permease [Opitutaceae bacterium]